MARVLILGNGKSRLNQKGFISTWKDGIWGCNRIFNEYSELPRLNRVTGDLHGLKGLIDFKRINKASYEIYAKKAYIERFPKARLKSFTVPNEFQNDSGTSLIAQALFEGYDKIYVAGFDLGGPDVYVKMHEHRNKTAWVNRWRAIYFEFGLDRVHFVGKNHKDFIMSTLPANTYSKIYTRGGDHLNSSLPAGKKMQRKPEVLILGNGVSRLRVKRQINEWMGEIWACNHGYKEAKELPRLDRVCTVHNDVAMRANIFKKKALLKYQIFVRNLKGVENIAINFTDRRGWSTGSLALLQALHEKYKKIILAGFDFGGQDIYQKKAINGGNFKRQFDQIKKEYDLSHVWFLTEDGYSSVLTREELEAIEKKELSREIPNSINQIKKKIDRPPEYDFISGADKIIIIDNGENVLNYRCGRYIDSDFNAVVRINDYVIRGYEDSVGSKTHYWASGEESTLIVDRDIEKIQPLIFFSLNVYSLPKEKIKKKVSEKLGDFVAKCAKIIPEETIKRICKECENFFPSTRLMVLIYFALVCNMKNVYIYGYNFIKNSKNYYDKEGFTINSLCDYELEEKFIKKLIKKGIVKRYEDCFSHIA